MASAGGAGYQRRINTHLTQRILM
ncbi:hypothetical protein [Pseudomonas abyssi]